MLQRQQYFLVVARLFRLFGLHLLAQQNPACRVLHHDRADDAREQNHHHHTVEHVGVYEIAAVVHLQVHAHHCHGYSAGGVGLGQSEHHVSRQQRLLERYARHVCCYGLAQRAYHYHAQHYPQCIESVEQHAYVDEHSDTDKEIWNEERVAYELDAVHQR